MGFFDFLKSKDKKHKRKEELKELLKEKYTYFENVLNINNHVLSIMADLEEKFSGDYLFDMHYIKTNMDNISKGVFKMIQNLNILADNKYLQLEKNYKEITEKIEKYITSRVEIPITDFTLPIDSFGKDAVNIVGGKMAHLAELKNNIKLLTPDGFSITSYAFIKFIEYNKLQNEISKIIQDVDINKIEDLESCSKKIQTLIINSEVPEEITQSINSAYDSLCKRINKKCNVSVRSSAIHEDSDFSFAGQYSSFLNVQQDLIPQKYKEVI
ncbi:MAG: PEP/pyruvate-binding domain-containing protein, partial [bacterium]|nr:PEP/pyruvate-binding domain-containing protein [bacterium]